ncbi:hypothetical protein WICPIJ_009535 [Wickerhamomyces pijperi]|uniref:Uncharacterized protein n=1 Tax=Wickerhamomyces pijperi TaxID=599730 RepID=A0A9P8PN87_WICPI|nr:hypothetical protein WICPIJ_009535 [Wickerhamomyces pijperi]
MNSSDGGRMYTPSSNVMSTNGVADGLPIGIEISSINGPSTGLPVSSVMDLSVLEMFKEEGSSIGPAWNCADAEVVVVCVEGTELEIIRVLGGWFCGVMGLIRWQNRSLGVLMLCFG